MGHKEVSAKISGFSKCSGETTTSLLPVADRTQVGRGVCRQESSGIDVGTWGLCTPKCYYRYPGPGEATETHKV